MNISKLYQRAHALRMRDKACVAEVAPAEFYIGRVIGDCFINPEVDGAEITFLRASEMSAVTKTLRCHGLHPEARHEALLKLSWPPNWHLVWERLLATYGHKPRLLLAIADGMEA